MIHDPRLRQLWSRSFQEALVLGMERLAVWLPAITRVLGRFPTADEVMAFIDQYRPPPEPPRIPYHGPGADPGCGEEIA